MSKLRIISLLTVMILVFSLAGCGNAGEEPVETPPEDPAVSDASGYVQISFLVCIGDPASYIVYVITPDRITTYDFTRYWMNAADGYHYFDDEMPDEDEYSSKWIDLSPEGWDKLINSLVDNKFERLPEDMHVDDIYDGPSYYIEVKTEDVTHLSGGYCAGLGDGKKQERYGNVVETLREVIHDAEEEAKEAWSQFTEPQEPVYLNEPATADVFSAFDERTEFSDLEYYFGPYDEVDEDSLPIRYGWELTDGGIAWVTFGAQSRVSDIELRYDDHFVILKSKLDGISEDPDEIYVYKDIDDLTDEESRLFYLLSDLINNETQAISEDHLHSLDDYWIVSQYGEELDLDEPAILGQDSPFSQSRMPSAELAAFYSEVLGEERVFEPMSDPDYRPEIGIICADDGYCYSYNGCGWADYSNIVSVAEGSSVIIVDSEILNSMSVDENPTAYVRFVLTPTDSAYGYELTDYRYYRAS